MQDVTNALLLVYAGLFPIINPIGGAPIFLALTRDCSAAQRRVLSRKIAINGFLLLVGSLFVGSYVLQFFGITLPVVRIAGGLVLIAFAWKLLHSDLDRAADPAAAVAVGDQQFAIKDSFYPLTMPLTVGPGSISVAVALGSQRPAGGSGYDELALMALGALLGLLAIALTIYVCYRFADAIVATVGISGMRVLVRLTAFILLCIGIQIAWNGYLALSRSPI
jgi:multiple antibiotic resistance protein